MSDYLQAAREEAERLELVPLTLAGYMTGNIDQHRRIVSILDADETKQGLADLVEDAEASWQFEFDASRDPVSACAYTDPGPKAEYVARAITEYLKELLA